MNDPRSSTCMSREEEVVCGGSTLWIIAVIGSSAVSSFRELTGRPEDGRPKKGKSD